MEPIAEEPVRLVPTPPVAAEDGVKKDLRPLPMPQKQFNLLTQAFKGSSSHAPSPHGRKPSVLKLSKRTESEDLTEEKNSLVSFASRDDIEPSLPKERTMPTVRELPGYKSILKRTEHAIDIKTITSPLHRTEPVKVDAIAPAEHIPTEAEVQEKRLQDLLKSIEFHTQRDQSISTIDLKVRGETQWLQNQPSNDKWTEIVHRVSTNRTEEHILNMAHQNDIADRFIDTMEHHTGAVHVNNLLNGADNEKERLVVRFTFALLNDVVDELMREVSAEITSTITQASGILNKSLVKSLASVSLGMEGSSSRFWKMSGREYVLKGALLDSLRPPTITSVSSSGVSNDGEKGVDRGSNGGSSVGSGGGSGGSSVGSGDNVYTSAYSSVYKNSRYDKNTIRLTQPKLNTAPTTTPMHPPLYDTLLPLPPVRYDTSAEFGYDSDSSDTDEPNTKKNVNTNNTSGGANVGASTNNITNSIKPNTDYIQQLHRIEVSHWSGINFTSIINHPLQIPSTIATSRSNSVVSCVRMFPLSHVLYASLLVCGLCNGRVVVYVVRYTGEPAEIICTTALPVKSQQVPIVDIKCGSSGVSSITCMNTLGMVSVYHINTALTTATATALQQVQRKKWTLFSYNTAKKSQNMANMYNIHPTDMIFTHNTLLESINASKVDKNEYNDVAYDNIQSNVTSTGANTSKGIFTTSTTNNVTNANIHPTSMCFHPSITLFGNYVSFMVGANNGDIIKYNMDYVHDNMASTIIYPTTPFIQKEYIHPNNAIKGFVLTNGINEKYGNKVYRELFHYHKHKIILLDVVNSISPYIVSVDQSGCVALWCYNSTYFEGKCWFRPYSSTKLLLSSADLVPIGEYLPNNTSGVGSVGSVGGNGDVNNVVSSSTGDEAATTNASANTHSNTIDTDTNTANNTTTTIDDSIKSQLTVCESYLTNTTVVTNTKSGTSSSVSGGDKIHKVYYPVYSDEYGVYVQYRSVEYDVVVTELPTVDDTSGTSGISGGALNNALPTGITGDTTIPVTTTALPATTNSDPSTSTTSPTTVPNNTTTSPTTTYSTTSPTTDESTVYSSRVMGNSLRKSAASPRVGSVVSASGSNIGSTTDNVIAAPVSGDATETTTVIDGSTKVDVDADTTGAQTDALADTLHANDDTINNTESVANPSTAGTSSVDENGIRVFSEPPDTTTANTNDTSIEPNLPLADATTATENTHSDPSSETALVVPTANADTTHTSLPTPLTAPLPAPLLCTIEEEAEVEVATLDDSDFKPPVLPPLLNPTKTDIAALDATRTTHSTPEPIPLTIFTRLTALIEQYREHEVKVLDHFNDINAEGSVEPPVLGVQGRSEGGNGAGDQRPEPAPITTPVPSDPEPITTTLPTTNPTITTTPPITTLTSTTTPTAPTSYTKRIIEYSQAMVLTEQTLNFTIVSTKMSYDGAEVVMLLASRYNVNNTTSGTNTGNTSDYTYNNTMTVYYLMPYFPLLQSFHPHYPRLYMKSNDSVVDYCVGPLQFETLTRTVFVLTKRCVRLFSLHTGKEIITIGGVSSGSSSGNDSGDAEAMVGNNGTNNPNPINTNTDTNSNTTNNTPLPFTWSLPAFNPTTIALCPSQRVLTLSATDDARIAVYLLQHTNDGSSTANTTEDAELLNRFKLFEKIRPAVKSSLPASEGTGIHTVLNIVTYIPPEMQYIMSEMQTILDLVYDHVWTCIETNLDHSRRKGLLDDIYSGDLGYIEPTTWPVNKTVPSLKISSDSVLNVSPRTRKRRKRKEKRIKNVGSVDSVEIVTPRDDVVGSVTAGVGGVSDGERGGKSESEDELSVMM